MGKPYERISKDAPERSCVVCRKRAPKQELLRFVVADGDVVWDEKSCAPGRGAYVHPSLACCGRLSEKKLWEFAFRSSRPQIVVAKLQQTAERVLRHVTRLK